MTTISTAATQLLGMQHPIMLAGMGQVANAELAAAVSNAGGLGVIGGVSYTPNMLKEIIVNLKSKLTNPSLPFGVDLLLPKVGGTARKTNYDYTKGTLDQLIDIIIEEGAKLFVSAVGIPPIHVIDRLHKHGIVYMNMVGHPKHAVKACEAGADMICAQGGEGGGHGIEFPTSVLIPACVDICKSYTSPLTNKPVQVVAAGGIFDGRGTAAALMLGASAVWIGTRFVTAKESGAVKAAKQAVIGAGYDSTIKSTIWTGRPLRALKTQYISDWETKRLNEKEVLEKKGILPFFHDMETLEKEGKWTEELEDQSMVRPMGVVAALINTPDQSAEEIVKEIVASAIRALKSGNGLLVTGAKL